MTVFSYLFVSLFCFCVCFFFFLFSCLCVLFIGGVFFSFLFSSHNFMFMNPDSAKPTLILFLFVFIHSRIEQELMARMISDLNSRHQANSQLRDPARASSPDDSTMSADSSQTSMGEPTIINNIFICLLACLLAC